MALTLYNNGGLGTTYDNSSNWNNSLGKLIADGFGIKWDELDDNDENVESDHIAPNKVTAKRAVQLQFGAVGDGIIEYLLLNLDIVVNNINDDDISSSSPTNVSIL